mgnify:CR=1 FL=1
MIKSLFISNFQSHKKSKLDFSPGVNVIIGSSDSGKTSILRALRWLIWNRPGGESFRSHWAGKKENTQVTIELGEKDIISKTKGADNQYFLNDLVFNAFGTEVPKEIMQVLQMSDVNLQQQLDSTFLLSKSSGEIAQYFNHIAHLDVIGIGIKNTQQWINALEASIKNDREQLAWNRKEEEQYDFLDKMEIDIEILESLQTSFTTTVNTHKRLEDLCITITEVDSEINTSSKILIVETLLTQILANIDLVIELQEGIDELTSAIIAIELKSQKIAVWEEISTAESLITAVLKNIDFVDALTTQYEELNSLCLDIESIHSELEEAERVVIEVEEEFHKSMPLTCPLCGSDTEKHNY